jgi:hypothetical protein
MEPLRTALPIKGFAARANSLAALQSKSRPAW